MCDHDPLLDAARRRAPTTDLPPEAWHESPDDAARRLARATALRLALSDCRLRLASWLPPGRCVKSAPCASCGCVWYRPRRCAGLRQLICGSCDRVRPGHEPKSRPGLPPGLDPPGPDPCDSCDHLQCEECPHPESAWLNG